MNWGVFECNEQNIQVIFNIIPGIPQSTIEHNCFVQFPIFRLL